MSIQALASSIRVSASAALIFAATALIASPTPPLTTSAMLSSAMTLAGTVRIQPQWGHLILRSCF